jgi:hypothetical protein
MLYGFYSLSATWQAAPFSGEAGQIATLLFVSLLFFYICKSAPGMAQSLLTGTPSLSATGAISAVSGAIAGVRAAGALAGGAMGSLASGTARTAFGAQGMLTQAGTAANTVKALGGDRNDQAAAFLGSVGSSVKETVLSRGGDLTRSLLSRGEPGSGGGRGSGGSGAGVNRHNQIQQFLENKTVNGEKQTFREYTKGRVTDGIQRGREYMRNKEAGEGPRAPENAGAGDGGGA